MIRGSVRPNLEASIWVKVFGTNSLKMEIEVVIDTGYDSYLTLPGIVISTLGLPPYVPVEVTLADGSLDIMDLSERNVLWEGQRLTIPIHGQMVMH